MLVPEVGLVCMVKHNRRGPNPVKVRILSVDETWIHYEILEGSWKGLTQESYETVGDKGSIRKIFASFLPCSGAV